MDSVAIVTVDNGDTEPELWAFARSDDAEAFAEARGNSATVTEIPIQGETSAAELIDNERFDAGVRSALDGEQ